MASDGGGGAGAGAGASATLDSEQGWGTGPRVGRFYSDYASQQPQLQILAATTVTTSTIPASSILDREPTAFGAGGRSRPERKRSGKRSAPYERPATGRHAAAGPQAAALRAAAPSQALVDRVKGGGAAWLGTGFSKIISSGATYLYSSIFRRQLAPPLRVASRPSIQAANVHQEQSDADDQISSPSAETDDVLVGSGQVAPVDDRDFLETEVAQSSQPNVEDLWRKNTLSRDEFERLTGLLRARVVSNGAELEQQPPQHDESEIGTNRRDVHLDGNDSGAQRWRQNLQNTKEERDNNNNVRTLTIYENGRSSSAAPPRDLERTDSLSGSPVEVAIAFMGGRVPQPSGASPVEPLNRRDENRLSSGPALSLNPSQTPLTKRTVTDVLAEDQLRTPTPTSLYPWGRDRPVFRTPYSRPVRLQPPKERAIDGTFGTPSVNRWTPIRTPVTGGREMLKRRSTVLDDGWTSGGPIRRTKHKSTISGNVSNLSNSRGSPFPATPIPTFSTPVGKFDSESLSPRNVVGTSSKKDALVESGNFYVPAQSSATARKILETLERMTPSPKGKALGEELAIVRDRPIKLTEGMLNDQARRSMSVIDVPPPNESREPGPSSRMAEDSFSLGLSASAVRIGDTGAKAKGKGKATTSATENGPAGLDGAMMSSHGARLGDGSMKASTVLKEADPASSSVGRSKGFHMNATFEESGSEDEGRAAKGSPSVPVPSSTSMLPTGTPKTSTVVPPAFATNAVSSTTTTVVGPSSVTTSTTTLAISKPPPSSGFSFQTRPPLEGPPTPKAMFPATTSPPPASGASFFQFGKGAADPLGTSRSAPDQSSTIIKEENQSDAKSEFSFGSPAPFPSVAPPVPKLQMPFDSKGSDVLKHASQSTGNFSANAMPALPSAFPSAVASVSPPSTTVKFGDSASMAASSAAPKTGSAPASIPSFSIPSSTSIFGSGLSQSGSGTAPANNFAGSSSSPFGASLPAGNLFGSSDRMGSLTAAPGFVKFGQASPFPAKTPPTKTGPSESDESQPTGTNDGTKPLPESERPQKRSMSSLQQDFSKAQAQPSTMSAPSFPVFGASTFGTSATIPATTSSFASVTSSKSTSTQGQFPLSFGQTSGAPQLAASGASSAAGSSAAASSAFTFGAPASAGGSTSASLSTGFGSVSSFTSFSSPAFGSASSGSTFGLTSVAPMAFGSSSAAQAFGSTGAVSSFGVFGSEASQSSSTSLFGSPFSSTAPSSAPAFAFGSSSPAFAFGSGPANSSGSPFTFGSSPSFPFSANDKSVPAATAPVLFGASSSVPAFGSTTNGTLSGDLVVNDLSNMDDNSMAEEPSQLGGSVFPQPSVFGAQSSTAPGSFVFGSPAGDPAVGQAPVFGAFPSPTNPPGFGAAAAANPFAPGPATGSLEFGGGAFALGSGGDRPARKMFKAKRTGAKRGK